MDVFVCYEANYHECAMDAGPVNCVTVVSTPELALAWLKERIVEAKNEGFVYTKSFAELSDEDIIGHIEFGAFSLDVYYGSLDNHNRSYDIVVEKRKIQIPESEEETEEESENHKKFVDALVSSVSVDAIVEYVNGDEDDLLFTQMQDVVRKTVTNVYCPKCDSRLFYSDLPQYDYTCSYCDENFCECEVRR